MDVFRKEYVSLNEHQKELINTIKNQAQLLWTTIDVPNHDGAAIFASGRETALAKTKLEECVMWAVKAITQ